MQVTELLQLQQKYQIPSLSTVGLIYNNSNNPMWEKWIFDRPVARIFWRGLTWVPDVHLCMQKHARLGSVGAYMLP